MFNLRSGHLALILALVAACFLTFAPHGASAQSTDSSMSADWASSANWQSSQDKNAAANTATTNYLLRHGKLGNQTTINGGAVFNSTTNNSGPVSSSSATNIGQYSQNNQNVGDNSMATLTTDTGQTLNESHQGATSTVTSTGNTSYTTPH